jgi:hypothetical protein
LELKALPAPQEKLVLREKQEQLVRQAIQVVQQVQQVQREV